MINNYFKKRKQLLSALLLIDIRLKPQQIDLEFMKYLKEQGYEIDNTVSEEVIGFGEILPKLFANKNGLQFAKINFFPLKFMTFILSTNISKASKFSPKKTKAIIAEVGGIRKKTETVLLAEFFFIKNIKIVNAPNETSNIWWLIATINVDEKSINGF